MAVALLALTLTSCAWFPARGPTPAAQAPAASLPSHAMRVAAFDDWRLSGRIAVQNDDQGFTADVAWRQSGREFDLRVMAPLNRGTFRLNGGAGLVELVTPDGEIRSAADPEALMHEHLGWSLPLEGARYWIRGLPDPRTPPDHAITDAEGRWTDFEQDRWRISVLDYTRLDGTAGAGGAELDLPRKLFLARDEVKVRFVITQWERR